MRVALLHDVQRNLKPLGLAGYYPKREGFFLSARLEHWPFLSFICSSYRITKTGCFLKSSNACCISQLSTIPFLRRLIATTTAADLAGLGYACQDWRASPSFSPLQVDFVNLIVIMLPKPVMYTTFAEYLGIEHSIWRPPGIKEPVPGLGKPSWILIREKWNSVQLGRELLVSVLGWRLNSISFTFVHFRSGRNINSDEVALCLQMCEI